MGFSFHTGVLWSEVPGRDNPDERPKETHIGPLRAIRRARTARDSARLAALKKRYPREALGKATYDHVAEYLKTNLGIPGDYFYDLNSYGAAELIGGVTGVVATALCWNRADTEEFSKLVGGMGVSAVMGANPLLLIVTIVALAKAFHKAHHAGEYAEFVAERTTVAANETKTLADRHLRTAVAGSGNGLG